MRSPKAQASIHGRAGVRGWIWADAARPRHEIIIPALHREALSIDMSLHPHLHLFAPREISVSRFALAFGRSSCARDHDAGGAALVTKPIGSCPSSPLLIATGIKILRATSEDVATIPCEGHLKAMRVTKELHARSSAYRAYEKPGGGASPRRCSWRWFRSRSPMSSSPWIVFRPCPPSRPTRSSSTPATSSPFSACERCISRSPRWSTASIT